MAEIETKRPIPKPLYEIQVPAGNDAAEARLEELMLQIAGGFQARGVVHGGWRDPDTGTIYREPMVVFQVACEEGELAAIEYEAMLLYPRERAFYVARIGKAEILDRTRYINRAQVRAEADMRRYDARPAPDGQNREGW